LQSGTLCLSLENLGPDEPTGFMTQNTSNDTSGQEEASEVAGQGLETIAAIRERSERQLDKHQLAIEVITGALGRPRTLYVVLTVVIGWTSLNVMMPALFGRPPLDPPPFFWLQGSVALLALLMTTLVLITENRQTRHAEERAHLDLQVNLLTEQKVAKLIALVEELRRDLPMVRNRVDHEAESMQHAVDREAVMAALVNSSDTPVPEPETMTEPPPSTEG